MLYVKHVLVVPLTVPLVILPICLIIVVFQNVRRIIMLKQIYVLNVLLMLALVVNHLLLPRRLLLKIIKVLSISSSIKKLKYKVTLKIIYLSISIFKDLCSLTPI